MSDIVQIEGSMTALNPLMTKDATTTMVTNQIAAIGAMAPWDTANTYDSGDRAEYLGIVYEANAAVSASEAAPTTNAKWFRVLNAYYVTVFDALKAYAQYAIVSFTDSSNVFSIYQANQAIAVGESPETDAAKWDVSFATIANIESYIEDSIANGETDKAPSQNAVYDALALKEDAANKDATGGYAGLTLFKINFKDALNTVTSFFTNDNTTARTYSFQNRDGTIADHIDLASKESGSSKDATGGYVGLTLFKINFKNALNTFTSFLTNANTAARTYTFQDRDGTIADNTDLALKEATANKGIANGYASLDGGGKVPVAQLPSAVMTYEGVWNATTNTPTLIDGTGDAGMVYRVSTAGSQDLGSGSITYAIGDYVIYNGTIWEKSDTTDAVASVAGKTGIVTLVAADITDFDAEVSNNTSVAANTGKWTTSGGNLYRATGNVSIGNATPIGKFDVRTDGQAGIPALGTAGNGINLARTDGLTGLSVGFDSATGDNYLQAQRFDSVNATHLLLQPVGGNVYIGKNTTASLLDINGVISITADNATQITKPTTLNAPVYSVWRNSAGTEIGYIGYGSGTNTDGDLIINNETATGAFKLYTGATERLSIASTGVATFLNTLSASNLSGTNTGDNAANTNTGLVHTTGAESIAGIKTFTSAVRGAHTALTSTAASIAVDFASSNSFTHTFTENTTLANPSNVAVGQSGTIFLTQHASSPKTLAFGSNWKFIGGTVPTVTATNSAKDSLNYVVRSATEIECVIRKDIK